MGFVNIGGQTVHTSAIGAPVFGTPSISSSVGNSGIISISGTNSSITTSSTTLSSGQYLTWGGSTMNYSINKTTYHVLGEDIEVDGYGDPYLAVAISTLNILGKPFYDELKKNNVSLPSEIEEYLEFKFKILERDRKIKEILK
jgi:hypothetical protein